MYRKPDIAADRLWRPGVAWQAGVAVAEIMWQGGDAETTARRRNLGVQIVGPQHDLARADDRAQPDLLRRLGHRGVIADKGERMRRLLFQIGASAVKAEAEAADLADEEAGLDGA